VTDRSIEIDWLGGNCPVQAEGKIGGKPFYFRARGSAWAIAIGGDLYATTFGNATDSRGWLYQEEYPGGPFAAGWMSEAEARAFIEQAAQRYFFGK
jgi:hypothetical protein